MSDDFARVNIDGCSYPKYKNLISAIRKYEPRLLSSEYEAKEIRKWLRRRSVGTHGKWIIVLYELSVFFDSKYDEGANISSGKLKAVIDAIDKLKRELEDADDFLNIPKACDLMDCYFIGSPKISFLMHEFCIKENKKNPFDESIVDLIDVLRTHILSYGLLNEGNDKGNRKARLWAISLFKYLNSKYKQKAGIGKLIELLLNIRYPNEAISYGTVNSWIWRFKKKEKNNKKGST